MPDTVVRDGWAIGVAVYPPGSVGALHSEACVVVTGRTAQDVTRLLREPTDEDIERAAIALYVFDFDSWELESDGTRDHYRWWARKAIAAYRSPEEADRA